MLHIILLILKIIGIICLVLLGVLFLLLLTVFLVPVRYKGQGAYFEKPSGSVKVTWLLHIISATVSYKEELEVVVRLFGFRILPSKKTEGAPKEEADGREATDALEEFVKEPMVSVQEIQKPVEDKRLIEPEREKPERAVPERAESEQALLESSKSESPPFEPISQRPGKKKKNLFCRTAERIKRFFHHLMLSWKHLCDKLKRAEHAGHMAMDFLTDEQNKKTFHLIIAQGKKVVKHILPRKLKGYVTFGFDDPYTTGQILTGAAFLYPLYHRQFSLQPVFDRQIIEGELTFKGRIRMVTFLTAGVKILLNKNFRIQLKRFMNRGGM